MNERGFAAVSLAADICDGVLDLVYPPCCLVCGEAGNDYLCPECEEQIDIIEPPFCRKCGIPCESYHCPECRNREFAFDFACSAGTYDGVLQAAIHALKYDLNIVLAEPLGDLMVRCFAGTRIAGKIGVVVAIPVHRKRLVERGFNQAAELARRFCERTGLPLEVEALRKVRETRHQVDLPLDARLANLEGAFAVRKPERIRSQAVLLIDDVMTTGATLDEAADTLRAAGARAVYCYTLARSV